MLVLLVLIIFVAKFKLKKIVVIDPNSLFIDVRSPSEFVRGSIEGALNIPVGDISKKENEILEAVKNNKEKAIVVFCASGIRSKMAQSNLGKMGFVNVVNGGGYLSLKKRI